MRDLTDPKVNKYRRVELELAAVGKIGNSREGVFMIPIMEVFQYPPPGEECFYLQVIASSGGGWDHVSVSLPHRCPTWNEIELVRNIFSYPSETWVQFGVPEKEHVNYHPYCLHWWRDRYRGHRLPPSIMVGPK
jgi:hypothetical protein